MLYYITMSHPGAKRPSVPPQALRGASPAPASSEVFWIEIHEPMARKMDRSGFRLSAVVADIFNPFFYFFIMTKHEK
jgi:hypothetical protein